MNAYSDRNRLFLYFSLSQTPGRISSVILTPQDFLYTLFEDREKNDSPDTKYHQISSEGMRNPKQWTEHKILEEKRRKKKKKWSGKSQSLRLIRNVWTSRSNRPVLPMNRRSAMARLMMSKFVVDLICGLHMTTMTTRAFPVHICSIQAVLI